MKKKNANLYVRQYETHRKKPPRIRKSFLVLIAIVVPVICAAAVYLYRDMLFQKPVHPVQIAHTYEIPVYVMGGLGKLEENKIEISDNLSDKQKADLIITNLKQYKAIPSTAELNDMAIGSDGIMYLDFSRQIVEERVSAMTEILRTFSIVNSFIGSFRGIDKLQLLVEGQPVYTLNGTVYTHKPLEFNKDLLED